jgi:hypothetical protein
MLGMEEGGKSMEMTALTNQRGAVDDALEHFSIVRNVWVRQLILCFPFAVFIILTIDGIVFHGSEILFDWFRVTGYVTVAIASIFFLRLYVEVPRTLSRLWHSGAIRESLSSPPKPHAYLQFIHGFENNMNNRWGWLISLVGLAYYLVYYSGILAIKSWGDVIRLALAIFMWLVLGIVIWRLLTVAYMTSMIPRKFNLIIRSAHPDQSGGLKPLGDLCFANALVIIVPVICFAVWFIIFAYPGILNTFPQLAWLSGWFGVIQGSLFALILLGLVVFFLPIMEIHRQMVRQSQIHQQCLDDLGRHIDETNQRLIDSAELPEPAEVQKQIDALKLMHQVYDNNKFCPEWPFNREIALKLTLSQIPGLLGVSGISKPIIDVVVNILNVLQPK